MLCLESVINGFSKGQLLSPGEGTERKRRDAENNKRYIQYVPQSSPQALPRGGGRLLPNSSQLQLHSSNSFLASISETKPLEKEEDAGGGAEGEGRKGTGRKRRKRRRGRRTGMQGGGSVGEEKKKEDYEK